MSGVVWCPYCGMRHCKTGEKTCGQPHCVDAHVVEQEGEARLASAGEPWRARWQVVLRCRDCGYETECTDPSTSISRVNGFNRMFLAGGPEVCPECKNLKAAPESPEVL